MHNDMIIYRVTLDGLHCRSARELVHLKVMELSGVEAASISPDSVLTVFASAEEIGPDDIIRTLVDVGVDTVGPVDAEAPTTIAESELASNVEPAAEIEAATEPVAEPVMALQPQPVAEAAPVCPVTPERAEPEPAAVATAVAVEQETQPDASLREALDVPAVTVSPRAALVQRIQVAVSDSYYPSRIDVIPGVPVEITFGEGHGCLARVLFDQFGIDQDLTSGGGVVRLPGLAPGTYGFSCGMRMVHGAVVAEG